MINVGIVGGTGYTGVALLRLLVSHPDVNLMMVTSRAENGVPVTDIYPALRGHTDLSFTEPDVDALSDCDLVFFATPNGTAMKMAKVLLDAGTKIIDLAADFRLKDVEQWKYWYGCEHACEDLLAEAVYGLPEINRDQIKTARLVANPGCYPTATTLGFLPLIENGIVSTSSIVADCKSGASGAGRELRLSSLHAEVSDNFKAYAVSGHRHLPEITQTLSSIAGENVGLTFVPHLLPTLRGIHASLYCELTDQNENLQEIFEQRYDDEPFVDVLPAGSHPETRSVRGSNVCRIAVHKPQDNNTVVILSVIDNLEKGAAGQAVQNMNIMFGFEESRGLRNVPLVP
ncbi:MAG: N-acetyl-gamma-glutamyl-phosphate reductase [Gammaproteobacteria bacterium]